MSVSSLLRVFLAVLWLWPATALAQVEQWQGHMDAGVQAYLQQDYPEAEKQFTAAAKEAEQLGPQDPRLATTLNSLAETHRAQGRFEEAETFHKRALSIREKALGPGHAATAQSLNNLAAIYKAQRRYAEAIPLLKRALEINEKLLGRDHPDLAPDLKSLAELYRLQGRDSEAETLERRSQMRREPTVSADALWQSYIAAGGRAYQQGNYTEAERQWGSALKEAKRFGRQDPRLATSLNNLGELYRLQGRYAEAEQHYKWALAVLEKALRPAHPQVATSLNNLAALYHAQGRYAGAEQLYKRSLAIKEKALGPDHPSVAATLENYVALLREVGRTDDADKMEARAKAIRNK